MDHIGLLTSQLTDLFRIGLIAALIYTTDRNRNQTGVAIPLLAGVAFVAVIIATTMPVAGVPVLQSIMSGLVANAILVSLMWAAWSAVKARQK